MINSLRTNSSKNSINEIEKEHDAFVMEEDSSFDEALAKILLVALATTVLFFLKHT